MRPMILAVAALALAGCTGSWTGLDGQQHSWANLNLCSCSDGGMSPERAEAAAAIIEATRPSPVTQYQPYLPPVPQVTPYPQTVRTNCMQIGNQVSCTSQ
jgi:hypothetical protein